MDICLAEIIGAAIIFVGTWLLLFKLSFSRYGERSAAVAVTAVALAGGLALVIYASLDHSDPFPAEKWRQVTALPAPPTGLEFRRGQGIWAQTVTGEFNLARAVPSCLHTGQVALWNDWATANSPDLLSAEPAELYGGLPEPPRQPTYHTTVYICYRSADANSTVSYAVYGDGAVWCSERFSQGGPQGFVEAVSHTLGTLILGAMVCLGTWLVGSLLAVAILEVRLRWGRKKGTGVHRTA